MNIDNFIFSELKITASETVNIENDLTITQTQPISEIFNEKNIAKNNKKEDGEQTIIKETENTK